MSLGTALMMGAAGVSGEVLDGLVGWWAHANSGDVAATGTWPNAGSGGSADDGTLVNNAFVDSNGVNIIDATDTADFGYGDDWNFATGDFSVMGWIYVLATSNFSQIVLSRWITGSNPNTAQFILSLDQSANLGGPAFTVSAGGTLYTTSYAETLYVETWYHVVGLRDGTDIKVYLDGVLKDTTAIGSVSLQHPGTPMQAGRIGAGYNVNGYVGDLRIYNRALSQPEIAQIVALNKR